MGSDDQKSHNKTFRNYHVVITMDLLDIVEKLERTRAELTSLEKFVTALPADPALMLTIAGVRKRQEHLGLRFAQATEQQSKEARRGPE